VSRQVCRDDVAGKPFCRPKIIYQVHICKATRTGLQEGRWTAKAFLRSSHVGDQESLLSANLFRISKELLKSR
jgi:hypothetical protein